MKKFTTRIITMSLLCLTLNSYASQERAITATLPNFTSVTLPKDIFNQCVGIRHNAKTHLLGLPDKALTQVLEFTIDPTQPISTSIKNALDLSIICTRFNDILPLLGKLHACYSYDEKHNTMYALQRDITDHSYLKRRRALLLLVNAKAPYSVHSAPSLLETAVDIDDIEMATTLFQNGANANEKNTSLLIPIYFNIKSKAMLNVFTKNTLKWKTSCCNYSVLHARCNIVNPRQEDIEVLEALLLLVPHLINTQSHEKTPLDYAQRTYANIKNGETKEVEALIALLLKHNAKTAKEMYNILHHKTLAKIPLLKTVLR